MNLAFSSWIFWALLSASFAALTAVFGKVGVEKVGADLATFIRTIVILGFSALIVSASGQWRDAQAISTRSAFFLVLSGLATGASWLCYYRALQIGDAARVAPIDKLSVVLVGLFGVAFLGERLAAVNWLGILLIAGGAVLVAYRG
jgi:bacterial/archaeal transporter family protein